jgi:hypothetical protein
MADMDKLKQHLAAQFGENIKNYITHIGIVQPDDKPWLTEPNKLEWVDTATGLSCLIMRNAYMLNLCGYVKVPGISASNDSEGFEGLDVHGGVTFQGSLIDTGAGNKLKEGYWVGFDCAHSMDLVPSMLRFGECYGTYRTIDYVKLECEKLAAGIKEEMERRGREAVRIAEDVELFGSDTSLTAEKLMTAITKTAVVSIQHLSSVTGLIPLALVKRDLDTGTG